MENNIETVSLYRKYRPHNFDNLVGQDYIKTTLINAIKAGHLSHAYIFSGPRGTGKTSTARLIAKALCCQNPQEGYEPCDECEFCRDINEGRLIDLIEIDAASNRGIDEVRDLKEKINFAPSRAKHKIYIVDEVHMMTKEAFNALLKTLEEPPSHAYFVLATTEIHKVPDTIISRCQRFDFKRISTKALMTRLSFIAQKENIEAEDGALEVISRYVDGGLRDAIGLLEQLSVDSKLLFEHARDVLGMTSRNLLEKLYSALIQKNTEEALTIVNELYSQGSDLKQFVHEFVDLIREKMLQAITDGKNAEASELLNMIEIFQDAQGKLLYSTIPQLPLEIAIVKITGVYTLIVPERKVSEPKKEQRKEQKAEQGGGHKAEIKVETKAQGKESILPESDEKAVLSLVTLKEKWPRITERVKSPSLRMSLRSGEPHDIKGEKVFLQFNTSFHRDKVMEHEHRVELEKVFMDLFGTGVRIIAEVKAIEITPVNKQKSDDTFIDEALKIFGGEVLE